jgi:hypothetical protein
MGSPRDVDGGVKVRRFGRTRVKSPGDRVRAFGDPSFCVVAIVFFASTIVFIDFEALFIDFEDLGFGDSTFCNTSGST